MSQLREEVTKAHEVLKKKEMEEGPQAAFGYGGKFGVQSDRYGYFNKKYIFIIDCNMFVFLLEWINLLLDMTILHLTSSMPHRLIIVQVLVVNMVFNQIELIRYRWFFCLLN